MSSAASDEFASKVPVDGCHGKVCGCAQRDLGNRLPALTTHLLDHVDAVKKPHAAIGVLPKARLRVDPEPRGAGPAGQAQCERQSEHWLAVRIGNF